MQVTLNISQIFAKVIRHDVQHIAVFNRWHSAPNFVVKCSDHSFRITDLCVHSKIIIEYLMCQILHEVLKFTVCQKGRKGTVSVLMVLII